MSTRTTIADRTAPLLAVLAALAIAFALVPLASPAAAQVPGSDVTVERFPGTQRYDTARLIAEDTFPDADTVVVAKAEEWPDALAGSYLAGLFQAPVLLVSRSAVQTDTLEALENLDTSNIILLGGTAAIEPVNEQTLTDAGYDVTRVFGSTRYETSAALALSGDDDSVGEWDGERTAVVATGQQFADALVAGTVAFSEGFPILLTPTASLHPAAAAALTQLEIDRVIIPGGTSAVSVQTEAQIAALDIETTRVSVPGGGRWETAIAFADFAVAEFGYRLDHLNVATGFAFADALAMGPHAGTEGAPLLLTPGTQDALPASVETWLRNNGCDLESIHVAGGVGAVSEANVAAFVAAAEACDDTGVTLEVDSAAPGATVDVTFRGLGAGVTAIAVAGDCVLEGEILTIDGGGDPGPVIEASIVLLDDAPVGPCELTFTVTYEDGSTATYTATIIVTAAPDPRATVELDADSFPVGVDLTGTIAADEDITSVAVTGDCILPVIDLDLDTDGSFTLLQIAVPAAGDCELTFAVTFGDDDIETQTITVGITPTTG